MRCNRINSKGDDCSLEMVLKWIQMADGDSVKFFIKTFAWPCLDFNLRNYDCGARTLPLSYPAVNSKWTHLRYSAITSHILGINGVVLGLQKVVRTLAHEVVATAIECLVVGVADSSTPRLTLHFRTDPLPFHTLARIGRNSTLKSEYFFIKIY